MRHKISTLLLGLVFIAAGGIFIGNICFNWDINLFFKGWWTFLIILPSFISIIRSGFHPVNISFLAVGILLLLRELSIIKDISVWRLIFPIVLIAIGLTILFKSFINPNAKRIKEIEMNNYNFTDSSSKEKSETETTNEQETNFKDSTNDNNFDFTASNFNCNKKHEYSAFFSAQKVQFPCDKFNGATITAIFGGVDCDFRNAIIKRDIVINVTTAFGGSDIYLPSDVNIKVSSTPIFGGVSNKIHRPFSPNVPTVYINATCSFGGVDIY